jgi:hypothetical protein
MRWSRVRKFSALVRFIVSEVFGSCLLFRPQSVTPACLAGNGQVRSRGDNSKLREWKRSKLRSARDEWKGLGCMRENWHARF